jgi:hypothetical protein
MQTMTTVKIIATTAAACVLATIGMLARLVLDAGLWLTGGTGIEGPE